MAHQHSRRPVAAAIALAAATAISLVGCTSGDDTSDDVELTFAIVPDPSGASEFYRAQMDLFEEANPGISVKIIENPADQQNNAIELMFQQGDAPDVFRAQGQPTLDLFYSRGWVASLDDIATDEFISRFPEGSMDPGTSGLHRDGHLVSIPLVWGRWGITQPLIYNPEILAEYGYDEPPATWGELEEIARAITAGGDGQVFGFVPGSVEGNGLVAVASTGTPASILNGIDLTTGEPIYENPNLVTLVEQYRAMQADGVFEPGWESFDQTKMFTEFAAGRLAMYPAAAYHLAEIRKLAPDLDFRLAPMPVPDTGREGYAPLVASNQPIWSMSAESEHPDEALKLMDFLASVDFYRAYYEEFGSLTSAPAAWEDSARQNPDLDALLDVSPEIARTVPNPQLIDAGGAEFWAAAAGNADLKWTTIATQSIIGNEDYLPLAQQKSALMESLLDEAEADTPDLREALTFPDWDPLEDFQP